MNPHAAQPTSILSLIVSLWTNRQLVFQMARREVIGRYRGSILGLAWSFFNPVFMLTVYTFVFSVIFQSKWGASVHQTKTEYAILLFVGMIVLSFFVEVTNRAPHLVLTNTNYVKKVIFPLEILPVIAASAAVFHAFISLIVLLIALVILNGALQWTVIFIPLVFIPLILTTIGLAWILASFGVFLRDLGQTIAILTSMLMFLSPVFYPVSAVPKEFQALILANPLTFIIEQSREILIFGNLPDWIGLGIYTAIATAFAWIGYALFQKMRKGFADVL